MARCAITYKLPLQLKQPVETDFGYHLRYVSLVVGAHLSTEPGNRDGHHSLSYVSVIVSSLYLNSTSHSRQA
jgi:hypothetical protein